MDPVFGRLDDFDLGRNELCDADFEMEFLVVRDWLRDAEDLDSDLTTGMGASDLFWRDPADWEDVPVREVEMEIPGFFFVCDVDDFGVLPVFLVETVSAVRDLWVAKDLVPVGDEVELPR